jgi:hypothetical protein
MRKDMSKVLAGGARSGAHYARVIRGKRRLYRNRIDPDGEGGRTHLGMHDDVLTYVDRKEITKRLGPLKRYILRQIYRPWGTVFSEICQRADSRSATQWNVRYLVELLVEVNAVEIDGQVLLGAQYGHRPINSHRCVAYVDPTTKLLMPARSTGASEKR